ncbi:uncharacterized protein TNCV_4818771 [Trichonephila clavipes]|nr:uncharacterized protein TNCV_4818771 [Trichonephila clavipes]
MDRTHVLFLVGYIPGLGKVDSAFHPYCSWSINEYHKLAWGPKQISLQTDHLIGTSAHASQHPMVKSSYAVEQFHRDASLEAVDRRAPTNSKNWQWTMEDESRFNLWDHDGRICVRRNAGERYLPECVIERHSDQTPGVIVWGVISYHGRSSLQCIEGNLNSNRYVHEVRQPEVVPFLQSILGAIFQ